MIPLRFRALLFTDGIRFWHRQVLSVADKGGKPVKNKLTPSQSGGQDSSVQDFCGAKAHHLLGILSVAV